MIVLCCSPLPFKRVVSGTEPARIIVEADQYLHDALTNATAYRPLSIGERP